ncbi:shikimate dehydrogenase [Paracoccus sp. TK19116]|uniref:Shikimate dehydrogenase n=1 Tax=Paracoccus albicereus TaxID=2922394 RepID=A0ABT1MUW3_9RHOB|nr:shikimate dehydrogenase [Paracoccus albicereus]MCQ0972115.1 shikimate dehydrogenase [Paracoccus albicereus]
MSVNRKLLLGLIGDNITRSQSPRLHRLAGRQNGVEVRYDRLVPPDMGKSFEEVFAGARSGGYRGLNITYPYKERVAPMVRIDDPLVRAMGSVNTVIFEEGGPVGTSTDYTGFVAAYRAARPDTSPGSVLMIGTGGVGRAVAFGLVALGVSELRLVDRDIAKADHLAGAIRAIAPAVKVGTGTSAEAAAEDADGLINCTPVGMDGYPGTPLAAEAMAGAAWAFDAVYTPADTTFLTDAASAGLAVISGWELFFWQGVHAWKHFADLPLDRETLRNDLRTEDVTA